MSSRNVRTSLHQMQRLCRRGGLRSRQMLFPPRSSSSRISLSISSNLGAWTTCLTSRPLATRIVSFTDGVARFVSKMNGFTGAWPTSRATMRCCSTGPFKIATTAWTSTSRRTPSSSLGLHQVAGDMFASLLGRVVLLTILRRSSTPPRGAFLYSGRAGREMCGARLHLACGYLRLWTLPYCGSRCSTCAIFAACGHGGSRCSTCAILAACGHSGSRCSTCAILAAWLGDPIPGRRNRVRDRCRRNSVFDSLHAH